MDKENVSPQVPYCYPDYPPNVCLWRNGSTGGSHQHATLWLHCMLMADGTTLFS